MTNTSDGCRYGTENNPYPDVNILIRGTWALDLQEQFPTPGTHYQRPVDEERPTLRVVQGAA